MRLNNVSSGRPAYYDRNPSLVGGNFQNDTQAPHGTTSQFTYTVPTGRKAMMTGASLMIVRVTVAAPVGFINNTIRWGLNEQPLVATLFQNTIGAAQGIAGVSGAVLLAGNSLVIASMDLSTGGTVSFESGCSIVEFDA